MRGLNSHCTDTRCFPLMFASLTGRLATGIRGAVHDSSHSHGHDGQNQGESTHKIQ